MARPLRLGFAGALHHLTARGSERRSIFIGDHFGLHCSRVSKILRGAAAPGKKERGKTRPPSSSTPIIFIEP
jgi:hypothetical protein